MQNFIRRTAAALAVLCMAALLLGTPTGAEQTTYDSGDTVVGYYAGWAAYQGFTPGQIPAEHLTQINYAFAQIDPDTLTIALENPTHDKQNLAAVRRNVAREHISLVKLFNGFLKVDNVNSVAFGENVLCHFRVPASCLMSEMNTRFKKLLH